MAQSGGKGSAKDAAVAPRLAHDSFAGNRPRAGHKRASSMKTKAFNATLLFYTKNNPKLRLFALWYFTTLMIVWNILGHTFLGFEQSWATPIAAASTAIAISMLLDYVDARARNRE